MKRDDVEMSSKKGTLLGIECLKPENSQDNSVRMEEEKRKESLKEGDFNNEDNEQGEEEDIRRKIN